MKYFGNSLALPITTALTLLAGFFIQQACIVFANRFNLLDIPNARRRHQKSTPILGGVGVFLTWGLGITIASLWKPDFARQYSVSLLTMGASMLVLLILGILDDVRGIGPAWKLAVEFVVAGIAVAYEPNVHEICRIWSAPLGLFVWPIAMVWIVGVTNALNLIDGLDGLAGGMALLVSSSIAVLSLWTGEEALFATVTILILIPALVAFLKFNWAPAKIFLGDNGSLVLGFYIATTSLMCRPRTRSWVMIASVVLMLGYPILDTGLAVFRRYKKRFPLFKADRNHLHYRILRLGLSASETAVLLLSIGLYLQVTALCVNLITPAAATFGITVVAFSVFTLLHMVRSIEKWRVSRVYHQMLRESDVDNGLPEARSYTVMNLELATLLEAALYEERTRHQALVHALELMLSSMIRRTDLIFITEQQITIVFADPYWNAQELKLAEARFKEKLDLFLELYGLQCSLAGIPMRFEQVKMIITQEQTQSPRLVAVPRKVA